MNQSLPFLGGFVGGGRLKGGKSKKEAIEGLKSVLRGIVNCLKDKHDRQTKWLQIKK